MRRGSASQKLSKAQPCCPSGPQVHNGGPQQHASQQHNAPARARAQAWLAAWEGRARLVIGTRLAVFTPLPELGLIVVDYLQLLAGSSRKAAEGRVQRMEEAARRLADIGIPEQTYRRLGLSYVNPFAKGFWVPLICR